jgi:hypothetical protein
MATGEVRRHGRSQGVSDIRFAPAAVAESGVQRVPERTGEAQPRRCRNRDVPIGRELQLEDEVLDDANRDHPDALLDPEVRDRLRGPESPFDDARLDLDPVEQLVSGRRPERRPRP